jgi:rare lipoprotein A
VPASSGPLTAAHKHLPFGTLVRVTRTDTGKNVVVRINDRGPFVKGRILDVSPRAAELLEMVDAGLARVKLEIIDGAAVQSDAIGLSAQTACKMCR